MCANGGNWTGENDVVCTGNSLFRFSSSVPVGRSEVMIYSNQKRKEEMCFVFTGRLKRHLKGPSLEFCFEPLSTCAALFLRNHFSQAPCFFQINRKFIVYCLLQIFLPPRLMAHAPVKWCFTLIPVKTVL